MLKTGTNVIIRPLAKIVNPTSINIGNSVIIDDFVLLIGGKKTEIKNHVHIASFTSITGGGELFLEDFSGISSGCRLFTGNDDYLGGGLTGPTIPDEYRNTIRSFIRINKHAVIGANTVILPGVTIGEGVSVGANSLIKSDLLPWTIYAGSPAKIIGKREKKFILELEQKFLSNQNEEEFIINYL